MKNNKQLISGNEYSLKEIFAGENNKVIIPDLQRDYCWGNSMPSEETKSLVNTFLDTLFKLPKDKDITMGLIYGYYDKELTPYHLQLCDGQQRLTTLFLLLGVINHKLNGNHYQQILISDFEYKLDDKEPHLLYSIRESSLYFLSDLTCHYFLNKNIHYNDIESQVWYLNAYKTDPTIQSMLKAIKTIEDCLANYDEKGLIDLGNFLRDHLKFLFYDMGNRLNGEETFVVINTTGEPLSATQNLKPLVIYSDINRSYGRIDSNGEKHLIVDDWENIETWFWQNRRLENGNDTAEAGFNEFLRWITIIYYALKGGKKEVETILQNEKYEFPINEIRFEFVYKIWETLKLFKENSSDILKDISLDDFDNYLSPVSRNNQNTITQRDCFILLPLLVYCYRNNVVKENRQLLRLYQFLKNLLRREDVTKNINNLVFDVIRIASEVEDIKDINIGDDSSYSKIILTPEEKRKIQIYRDCDHNKREEIETLFWEMQGNNILDGEIMPLIEWSTQNNEFDFNKFEQYADMFGQVFIEPCDANIDPLRQALITCDLPDYPKCFKGYKNYNFGWEYKQWQQIINCNCFKFKEFLDRLLLLGDIPIIEKYAKIIEENTESHWKQRYAPFVYRLELLRLCKEKNIQVPHKHIIVLLERERMSASYKLLVDNILMECPSPGVWEQWQLYGQDIIYTDYIKYDIAIDLIFIEDEFTMRIFSRNNIDKAVFDFEKFIDFSKDRGIEFALKNDGRWYTSSYNIAENLLQYEKLQKTIEDFLSSEDK